MKNSIIEKVLDRSTRAKSESDFTYFFTILLAAEAIAKRFLENNPMGQSSAEAWQMLGHACYQTGDVLGEIHAFIERSQITTVPFHDISNTANRLNKLLRNHELGIDRDQKYSLAQRISLALEKRRSEASADDLSRMAWLALNMDQESKARDYAENGLEIEPENIHCRKIAERLGMKLNS